MTDPFRPLGWKGTVALVLAWVAMTLLFSALTPSAPEPPFNEPAPDAAMPAPVDDDDWASIVIMGAS